MCSRAEWSGKRKIVRMQVNDSSGDKSTKLT